MVVYAFYKELRSFFSFRNCCLNVFNEGQYTAKTHEKMSMYLSKFFLHSLIGMAIEYIFALTASSVSRKLTFLER